MKRTIILLISTIFLLAACNNNQKDNQSDKDESGSKNSQNTNQVKQIATDKMFKEIIIEQFYLFKESQARGLLQDNMANSYNGEDFESGLLTLSKEVFPTNKYLYQDGQYLDKKTINAYLNPKYTKKKLIR